MVAALAAAGEPTRLRILALVSEAELTVTELMAILGQSQPRVSRHLKLLVDAGLISRHREGAWAFFRLAETLEASLLRAGLIANLAEEDAILAADRRRLQAVRYERAAQAAEYFALHAKDWDRIRALHIPEGRVEAALLEALADFTFESVLDIGTGTGRMLEVFGAKARRAVGLDVSPAMLGIARANFEAAGLRHVQLRQGDAYAIAPDLQHFDLVILHQVLHFLDDPARAILEASRALKPGGRLMIVDFAPHHEESLRVSHAHRRLGFDLAEGESFLREAGLQPRAARTIIAAPGEAGRLAVSIWIGADTRLQGDFPLSPLSLSPLIEVA
jgi:SAM-dependent methyltransferase